MRQAELDMQRALSERDLTILNAELVRQKKSVGVSYLLLIFLGWFGVHQLYIGRIARAAVYPLLLLIGWVLSVGGFFEAQTDMDTGVQIAAFGMLCYALFGLLCFWDLITLPRQHAKREQKIKTRLMHRMYKTA